MCRKESVWVAPHRMDSQDTFTSVGDGLDDDVATLKANDNENELKELRTFADLVHSKNKVRSDHKRGLRRSLSRVWRAGRSNAELEQRL